MLVPGAGYGHDAIAWARHGAEVTAVDFAPLAIAGLHERASKAHVHVQAMQADLFALPAELDARFDVVWEQTCLCAIDPARRPEYVSAMARVLVPAGTLYALLWNHGRERRPTPRPSRSHGPCVVRRSVRGGRGRGVTGSRREGEYLMTLSRAGSIVLRSRGRTSDSLHKTVRPAAARRARRGAHLLDAGWATVCT